MSTIAYCRDCGNPDCPNVTPAAYWRRCPALARRDARILADLRAATVSALIAAANVERATVALSAALAGVSP